MTASGTATCYIYLGYGTGSYAGSVTQEGGSTVSMGTNNEYIGVGSGLSSWTQTGGANTTGRGMFGSDSAAGAAGGTYYLNGGTLSAGGVRKDWLLAATPC